MYRIIGGDQREYGPVSEEQVIQWIREGRANGETKVRNETGGDWIALALLPQFAETLLGQSGASPGSASTQSDTPSGSATHSRPRLTEGDLRSRETDFSIGEILSDGWTMLTQNFGVLFASSAILLVINAVMTVLGLIPILGIVFSLAAFVITGPLVGGVLRVFLRTRRGEPTEVGDTFSGFRDQFVPLMLTYVVMSMLILLSVVPGALVAGLGTALFSLAERAGSLTQILAIACGSVLMLIPVVFLSVSWAFGLPLVVDREMHFWDALQLSMAVVRKRWFKVFFFSLVLLIIYLVGFVMCLVGLFVTVPLAIAAYTLAYEKLFG